ncbi:MAG: hypothetical protein ACRCYW_07445 [Aeromonas sp.]|uniref:hypothetical protein n=1 Tax=Aeromonas sp. TaxID=647 RepID=UPI003F32EB18
MTLMPGSDQVVLGGALSAERVTELTSLLTKGALCQEGETSPLAVLTALAIHIEQYRLDRTLLPVNQWREQLMIGSADLLEADADFEDQDAFRLLALLLDKLLRGGSGSRQAKPDGQR